MTTFTTIDDAEFDAADAADLVRQMRAASHVPNESIAAYMADVARSIRDESGARVSTDDPDEFVRDLMKAGYLTAGGKDGDDDVEEE